jgi:4-amino-4-deoxy-L-arabinose transferase-like glycosyltransferase
MSPTSYQAALPRSHGVIIAEFFELSKHSWIRFGAEAERHIDLSGCLANHTNSMKLFGAPGKRFRAHHIIWGILLLGVLIRIPIVLFNNGILWPDSIPFIQSSQSIALSGDFSNHPMYQTPGYPLFLAGFILILPQNHTTGWLIIIAQHILGLLSTFLIYKTAQRIFNRPAACLSALFFTLNPLVLYYEHVIHSETLFVFLLCLLMFFLSGLRPGRPPVKNILIIGLLSAALPLTRPFAKYLLILILGFLVMRIKKIGPALAAAASVLVLYFAALLPWMLNNSAHHKFFGVSQGEGLNLLVRSQQFEKWGGPENPFSDPAFKPEDWGLDPSETLDEQMAEYSLRQIKQHKGEFAVHSLVNWVKMFSGPENSIQFISKSRLPYLGCRWTTKITTRMFLNKPQSGSLSLRQFLYYYFTYGQVPPWVIPLLALLGACIFFRNRALDRLYGILMILTIVYITAAPAVFLEPIDRLRLPADPFLIMFAAWGVTSLVTRFRRPRPSLP